MMNTYSTRGMAAELASYETPFADETQDAEQDQERGQTGPQNYSDNYLMDLESPFSQNFNSAISEKAPNPQAADYVQLLASLNDREFTETLYEMASELQDSWTSKISNETAMGERFVPFAAQQSQQYFAPLINQAEAALERITDHFTAINIGDQSESEIEQYFLQFETDNALSAAQEQFLGGIIKKVKSVVKTAGNLVKKGINVVGKILPIGPLLNRIKGMIPILLKKVLQFAIGKLPQNLRPHAQNLAKKFLKLEVVETTETEGYTTGDIASIQTEFDNQVANMVFSADEAGAEDFVMDYENSENVLQRENDLETGGYQIPPLDVARQQFIDELKNLQEGESPAPAIERFLPAAILALQPVIKIAIGIIGRPRIINFLAKIIARLIGKYVPQNVAMPLASSIIDVGMSAIGFEVHETHKADVAYEAIANTIQETVQKLSLDEMLAGEDDEITAEVLQAFEAAAPNNFPAKYIRRDVLPSTANGIWVMKPRKGPKHYYKKYTNIFNVTIEPKTAKSITTFGGRPLSSFLKDNMALDITKPIQARVHLFESIPGTLLSQISKHDKAPGLGVPGGWVQLHPLSVCTAAMLVKEPGLGEDVPVHFRTTRHRIGVGQRFYYLEISGAKLKYVPVPKKQGVKPAPGPVPAPTPTPRVVVPARPSDIQCVLNFLKGEIRFNYFFSESDAMELVEKLKAGDAIASIMRIRSLIHNTLHNSLIKNIRSNVKIIHETMPELYLENSPDGSPQSQMESEGGGIGKAILEKVLTKVIDKLVDAAFEGVKVFFKTRAAEFIAAQANPADGVTVKVWFTGVPGMAQVSAIISGLKGTLSIGNVFDFIMPSVPAADVQVSPGKVWD
ncbi:MAG: hypothetical protein WA874_02825 [Chryseosolibacter sp.]